ncbi:MAG TPA: hypothetical protein VFA92_12960 [Candidatus Binatia bacterium]|jgi:hypothetical protein|nr:hypothetical protein [Candidatus Binatia bacterium]
MGEALQTSRGTRGGVETVYVVPRAEGAEDPFVAWVEEGAVAVVAALQDVVPRDAGGSPVRAAVVVELAEHDDWRRAAAAEGLGEAVRGIVHSLTRELGPAARLNTVLARDQDGDVGQTLDYLASPLAEFAAGSTFDLRGTAR